MPFTPLHMGPGFAIKAILSTHFSLLVFGFTQVAIDIEPLIRILNGDAVLHGHSHSYVGSAIISCLCFLVGWPLFAWMVRVWNQYETNPWAQISEQVSAKSAAIGALLGGLTHVVLDSIMHSDMQPMWPFNSSNALLHVVSIDTLHYFCLVAGVLGLVVVFCRHYFLWVKVKRGQ